VDYIEKMKELRQTNKVSIKTIAKLSGIPIGTIEHWEYCGHIPPIDKYNQVLNALGYELTIVKKEVEKC